MSRTREKVIKALKKYENLTVTEISRITKVSRTTVYKYKKELIEQILNKSKEQEKDNIIQNLREGIDYYEDIIKNCICTMMLFRVKKSFISKITGINENIFEEIHSQRKDFIIKTYNENN